ncbi:hypothetical protein SRHO_G00214940 [Serrasalmus rhombeus]
MFSVHLCVCLSVLSSRPDRKQPNESPISSRTPMLPLSWLERWILALCCAQRLRRRKTSWRRIGLTVLCAAGLMCVDQRRMGPWLSHWVLDQVFVKMLCDSVCCKKHHTLSEIKWPSGHKTQLVTGPRALNSHYMISACLSTTCLS